MSLSQKVCLVTGATRGIGRGIAVQLGGAGATVYVTGRTQTALDECATEIRNRGGTAVPVQVDHNDDKQVQDLFERIKREQDGKLDVLVNNAYSGVPTIMGSMGKKFWELDTPKDWDTINGVGLRNHYICTVYAARLMVPQRSGLIVNISSAGGLRYLFNVPYGIGKAGMDRMASDCAIELKKHSVAMVSLWPGAVKTEEITARILENPNAPKESKKMFADGESVEFPGMCVVHMAKDPDIMKKSGRILLTFNLAREYGFRDVDGRVAGDMLNVKNLLETSGHTWAAAITPPFIRIPLFITHYFSYKF